MYFKLYGEAILERIEVSELIRHLVQGVTVFNEQFRLIASNPAFSRLMDFPAHLCKPGTSLEDFFRYNAIRGEYGDGDIDAHVHARIQEAYQRKSHKFERRRPDGIILQIEGNYTNDDWLVSTYTDVTDIRRASDLLAQKNYDLKQAGYIKDDVINQTRQELRAQNKILQIITENTKHGISLFGNDLKLKAFNKRFLELMEFPDHLGKVGTSMRAMFEFNADRGEYGQGDRTEQIESRLALAEKFKAHKFERIRPDGTVIEIIGTPVEGGFVTTYTDITDLRRIQNELEDAQKKLEEKVHRQGRQIQESEKRISEFAAAASDWFWETDTDNRVRFISERFEKITGISITNALGMSRTDIACNDINSAQWRKHLAQLERHEPFRNFRYQIKNPKGKTFWVSISGSPYFNDKGTFMGYRGTGSDISQELKYISTIQESEQWLAAYFQQTPLAVLHWELNGDIIQWNPKATSLFLYNPIECLGQKIDILLPKSELKKFGAMLSALKSVTGGKKERLTILTKDKKHRICEWRNTPLMDQNGKVTTILSMIEDITDQVAKETEIKELNRNLENRVNERTQELKKANRSLADTVNVLKHTQNELVEAEKMSSLASLVGGVAHEVNTPLGVAVTAATHQQEILSAFEKKFETGQLKKSELAQFLEQNLETSAILLKNLERAAQLIKSFKQVAIDQNSGEAREINLNDYVEEVLNSLKPQTKKMQISIQNSIPDDILLETDPGAISQIITNLVMNSLIHAFLPDEQGTITLMGEQEGAMVNLLYSDSGKGMDHETVKKVFEPFFTTKRHEGGSGLGMHITYNLVTQKLKGTIKCISSTGNGTSFLMSIPKYNNKNHDARSK